MRLAIGVDQAVRTVRFGESARFRDSAVFVGGKTRERAATRRFGGKTWFLGQRALTDHLGHCHPTIPIFPVDSDSDLSRNLMTVDGAG